MFRNFVNTLKRELRKLSERRLYFFAMIVVPLFVLFILTYLMSEGLPTEIPTAIVDMDNTVETRVVKRNLIASQEVRIDKELANFNEAIGAMRRGEIYGFFMIPQNYTRDIQAGRKSQISYYTNSTFYIPGSLLYKGMKTNSTLASAASVKAYLVNAGASGSDVMALLQPVQLSTNTIGNPWINYSVYISNSFVPSAFALMILLVTAFSICSEEKRGTSIEWMKTSGNSMMVALAGKLLPHTVIFSAIGLFIQSYMFGYLHYPLNCNPFIMILAMLIFIVSNQALAVFICGMMPNLRLAVSVCSLLGVLTFSLGAFSFPLESMYGGIAIFSYIIPSRYYFLIYADQALNGFDIYYSRFYFAALLAFWLLPFAALLRLKKAQNNPVYVP